ncbi:MAG: hypothetical protein AAB542_00280 [Patescibacteria group bacterium]
MQHTIEANWFDHAANTLVRIATLGRRGVQRSEKFIELDHADQQKGQSLTQRIQDSTTLLYWDNPNLRIIPRFKIVK